MLPIKQRWLGLIISIILAIIGFENLGLWTFVAIPVGIIGYYRIIPDYVSLFPFSLWTFFLFIRRSPTNFVQVLKWFPPYSTELLWLPLPNHDRILASAFRQDVLAAMETFKKMQALPLPGFQNTIKQALPQIIAHQLTTVKTLTQLVSITKPEHPLLPLLVPTFYQSESELENTPQPEISPHIKPEISTIFPRLQGVARDVEAALEAGNAALRERGLERALYRLATLSRPEKLQELGLKPPDIERWKPAITRWQQLIKLELEKQQKQSQGEQLNPFQFGNPVRLNRDYLFKGRRKFADDIVRRILNSDRPTLIFYGPRRCGKTSFLYNLPRLFPSDVLPIFLDMQSAAITNSEADFCQGLVRAIHKDSKSQGVLLPKPPKRNEFKESPYTVLEDWLDEALEKLEDRQLLLNLDEFEKIGTAINEGQISLKLFDELRHLIQHYDQLGFLFSGVKTLDEIGPHWSSYFISVVPIEMLYLEPEEAKELLLDPDPEFTVRYDQGIVEEVLKLTRCQPYLLQLLGAAMVTQANLYHTDTITPELLKAAIEDGFINGEPYFTNIWTEFTGESEPEILAGQSLLLNLAKGEQPNNNRDEISEKALQYMLRHHIIEQIDNQYNFEILLVKMWVKQRAIA
ncbi:MAG: AAA family ATPase [Crocosphaera sp.]